MDRINHVSLLSADLNFLKFIMVGCFSYHVVHPKMVNFYNKTNPSSLTGVLSGADIQNTHSACSMILAGK